MEDKWIDTNISGRKQSKDWTVRTHKSFMQHIKSPGKILDKLYDIVKKSNQINRNMDLEDIGQLLLNYFCF